MIPVRQKLSPREIAVIRRRVAILDREIHARAISQDPLTFGLPDLLFSQGELPMKSGSTQWERMLQEESEEEYRTRQDQALKDFIEGQLYIMKDVRKVAIRTIPEMLRFIADVFFGRVKRVILWKGRGSGGSLSAAILAFLFAVYHRKSVLNVAGSTEQSKVIFKYSSELFECVPSLKHGMLDGPPIASEIRMKNGVLVRAIPCTEKQARGKHFPVLLADEACQKDAVTDRALRAAIQSVASEPDSVVVLLSTFHVPSGLFEEFWDNAEEKGFERRKWDAFDCLQPCTLGLEEATQEDPQVLEYCRHHCYLTERRESTDEHGIIVQQGWRGCNGKARTSQGWMTFDQLAQAKQANEGTPIFMNEFGGERPGWMAHVFDPELVDASKSNEIDFDMSDEKVVGIDWGFETIGSMAIGLVVRRAADIALIEAEFTDHQLVTDVIRRLSEWQEAYGPFAVWADSSHAFNNAQLAEAGFQVVPVKFSVHKQDLISNLSKYFRYRRIKILDEYQEVLEQLKGYRRNERTGAILKRNDHAVDMLGCAAMRFRIEEEFGKELGMGAVRMPAGNLEEVVRRSAGPRFSSPNIIYTTNDEVILI